MRLRAVHWRARLGDLALVASVMFVPEPAAASCTDLSAGQHGDVHVYDSTFVRRRGRTSALYDFEVDGVVQSYPCPICPFYPPGLSKGKSVRLAVRSDRVVAMGDDRGCQADESRLWTYRLKPFAWALGIVVIMLLLSKILPPGLRQRVSAMIKAPK
jgi:hypothetical protein